GRHGDAGLGVIGDGAGRLVISRGESLVVGKDGVEFLAQILELAAGAHFGKDGLHPAIVFGGVAYFVEDSRRLLLLGRLQGGDDACGGLCGALNLFGVTLRLQAFGGERGQLVPEAAWRRGRARGLWRKCGGWGGAVLVLGAAQRLEDVSDREAAQKV